MKNIKYFLTGFIIASLATIVEGQFTVTQPSVSGGISINGVFTSIRNNIITTSTDGFATLNNTAATALVPVQMSPRFRWRGNVWNTAANETSDFFAENLPATAATPTATWKLNYSRNGGGTTIPFQVTNLGAGTFLSTLVTGGSMFIPASSAYFFNGRSQIVSAVDGEIDFRNNAGNGFSYLRINQNIIYNNNAATLTSGFSTTTPTVTGVASSFDVLIAATPGITGTVGFAGSFTNVPSCNCTNTITANIVQCVPTVSLAVLNGVWINGDRIRCTLIGR